MTIRIVWIVNLISDAPQNDGRMIAVTPYHGTQILFVPFREIFKIALMFWRIDIVSRRPFIFRIFPLVKRLIHHKKSHRIAQLIQFRHMRVVAAPDRITATFL